MAGAEAKGSVKGEFNPFNGDANVSASGEAFAGAKVTARGEQSFLFGIIKVNGEVDGRYGAGIGGNISAGVDDGVFSLDIGGNAAVGLGGGARGGVSIDGGKVYEYASQGYTWVDSRVDTSVSGDGVNVRIGNYNGRLDVSDTVDTVGNYARDAVDWLTPW